MNVRFVFFFVASHELVFDNQLNSAKRLMLMNCLLISHAEFFIKCNQSTER